MAPAGYGNRVEGVHAVLAAARHGRVQRLFVDRGPRDRSMIQEIIELVSSPVTVVDDVRSIATTEAPQGVVAECTPLMPVTLETLTASTDAVMALDHLEDPHNLGAIARSALAAGMGGLVVAERRQAPLSGAAFKAAAGALEDLPVAVVGSIPDALMRLKKLGLWIIGLDQGAEQRLWGLELFTEPVTVVVGAEGTGLASLTSKRCDVTVSIPMAKGSESLNASVSAALAAFEIMRVRANAAPPPG
jgi:23S rRNA (guanosine2251-2'-O)-methyltransferase